MSGGRALSSPCPPVAETPLIATSMRGPGTLPRAMASRRATSTRSRLPRSRTVVKPLSSTRRALAAALQRRPGGGLAPRSSGLCSSPPVRWTWASISPGSSVTSPRSMSTGSPGRWVPSSTMTPLFDADERAGQHLAGGHVQRARRRHGDGPRYRRQARGAPARNAEQSPAKPAHLQSDNERASRQVSSASHGAGLDSTERVKVRAVRVAELIGLRQFRVRDGEIADPGPGEVQVEVQAVGICGSDLHAYSEGGIGEVTCVYPQVLGHEPAGVVARLGRRRVGLVARRRRPPSSRPTTATTASSASRAGTTSARTSGSCRRRASRGSSASGSTCRWRTCCALPAHVPVAMATHDRAAGGGPALAVAGPPALGETAAVFGAGPIGLLTVAALKRAGVGRVFCVEPVPHRRELARLMGADAQLGASPADAARTILTDTSNRGVDLVFDCAAAAQTADASLQVAASGGRVVFTGIPSERRVSHDVHLWRRKELAVFQVRRSNHQGHGRPRPDRPRAALLRAAHHPPAPPRGHRRGLPPGGRLRGRRGQAGRPTRRVLSGNASSRI